MLQAPDIFAIAYKQPFMQGQMQLIHERDQQIPGSVQYNIRRHTKNSQWNIDDTGMLVYHYSKDSTTEHSLELRFC
ncbi:MAG: AraC family transcriptional regulator, partial [Flavitalea sp.]